jgi:tRNA splicing ligase
MDMKEIRGLFVIRFGDDLEMEDKERKKEKIVRELVEGVKINFATVLNNYKFLESKGFEPEKEHYAQIFRQEWKKKVPNFIGFVGYSIEQVEEDAREGDPFAVYVMNYVDEMGLKLKTLMFSNLCVAYDVGLSCEECYFSEVCKIKK